MLYAWNNIIYGWTVGSTQAAAFYNDEVAAITLYAYNNTMADCAYGIYDGVGTTIARNNIANVSITGFTGSYAGASSNNVSNHNDAPGQNSKSSQAPSFVNAGIYDFHLQPADTVAKGAGVDLSGDATIPFTTDIDGNLRTAPWDIGADQSP